MKTKDIEVFKKSIDFDLYLQEKLKNPKFKQLYDEFGIQLEIAYGILQLRKKSKLSQLDLAKKIGTSQSNVARIESGNENVTIAVLQRIAKATNRDLKIEFVKN
jgi:DNA-binding XRE family transcriptional regulator